MLIRSPAYATDVRKRPENLREYLIKSFNSTFTSSSLTEKPRDYSAMRRARHGQRVLESMAFPTTLLKTIKFLIYRNINPPRGLCETSVYSRLEGINEQTGANESTKSRDASISIFE